MAFGKNEYLTLASNMWQRKTRCFTYRASTRLALNPGCKNPISQQKCIGTVPGGRAKAVNKTDKNPALFYAK